MYFIALYRCLILIDELVSNPSKNWDTSVEILESYSKIFEDRYVFGLILVILSLKQGINYSIFIIQILGQFGPAFKYFKGLDIKCIQIDTLGYLLSDSVISMLALSECESIYSESNSLYMSNRRETWGLICQSIENNFFSSAIDFYDFFCRLESSVQFASNELMMLKYNFIKLSLPAFTDYIFSPRFKKACKILEKVSSSFVDNRDFSIFDTVDPTGRLKSMTDDFATFSVS
jgi:hypothetical protein